MLKQTFRGLLELTVELGRAGAKEDDAGCDVHVSAAVSGPTIPPVKHADGAHVRLVFTG